MRVLQPNSTEEVQMRWLEGKRMKINRQQIRTMRQAGFKISSKYGSIIVWRRGDIRLGLNPSRQIGLKDLIGRVIRQAEYWTHRRTQITHSPVLDVTPKEEK